MQLILTPGLLRVLKGIRSENLNVHAEPPREADLAVAHEVILIDGHDLELRTDSDEDLRPVASEVSRTPWLMFRPLRLDRVPA